MTNKAPFCAFLWLTITVSSRLLKKALSIALWTKASLCVKSSLLEKSLPRTPRWQIRSLPTYQVGPRNLFTPLETCLLFLMGRNPWLINDLRPNKALYACRASSTDVERTLQIHLFLTNKANFQKSQMNVSYFHTRNYEKKGHLVKWENKANTNPIQSQYKANSNPIQSQYKPNTNPICRGVASGEDGSNPISGAKKCCSPPFCWGISYRYYYVV